MDIQMDYNTHQHQHQKHFFSLRALRIFSTAIQCPIIVETTIFIQQQQKKNKQQQQLSLGRDWKK